MKLNRSLLLSAVLLLLSAALYRVWEGRPFGFAPQIAMALFGGAMIKDKKWAFALPLLSMFVSDLMYEMLYQKGYSSISGFYGGQWINYLCIAGVTAFGFLMKKISVLRVTAFSMSSSILFFLVSNFFVWLGGGGYHHPKTFGGLMLTYADGLAFLRDYGLVHGFYGNLFIGDLFFCTLLFGAFFLVTRAARVVVVS